MTDTKTPRPSSGPRNETRRKGGPREGGLREGGPRKPTSDARVYRAPRGAHPTPAPQVVRDAPKRLVMTRESIERQFVSHEDPCRVLAECGACTFLDLEYRKQLQMKSEDFRALVVAKGPAFAKARVMDCTPSDVRFGYRHTAKLVVNEKPDRFAAEGREPKRWITIGLYRPGTHQVVDIGPCPVQTPHINSVVSHLRKAIKTHGVPVYDERSRKGDLRYVVLRTARRNRATLLTLVSARGDKPAVARFTALARELMERFSTTLQGVLLHVNDAPGNAIFLLEGTEPSKAPAITPTRAAGIDPGLEGASGETLLLTGKRYLEDEIAGLSLRVAAESFFQVNPHVAGRMYNRIVEVADPAPSENALDLYCGVGGISLLLATRCRRVVGIEESPSSVADARHNAEVNRIPNVDFFQGRAEDTLGDVIARGVNPRYDIVTLNPSRRGCQPSVLGEVVRLAPRRIVYMSCFADTLLRDAALLAGQGYRPVFFEPFDMFPGTSHMEILCVLDRAEGA